MPRSGKAKSDGPGKPSALPPVETDPLIEGGPQPIPDNFVGDLSQTGPAASFLGPAESSDFAGSTEHDAGPRRFSAASAAHPTQTEPEASAAALSSTGDDAWASYDEGAVGEGWGVSSGGLPPEALANTGEHGSLGPPTTTHTHAPVRLVAQSGDHAGRVYPVEGADISVGRGPNNGIVLNDPSVSREHARLLQDAEGFKVVDRRSGNGTFVNGQKIQRAELYGGEEVAFGKVILQFVVEGSARSAPVGPKPSVRAVEPRASVRQAAPRVSPSPTSMPTPLPASAPRPPRARRVNLRVLQAVGLLAIVGVGAWLLLARPTVDRNRLFRGYLAGIDAFKGRRFGEAEEHFRTVLQSDPTSARSRRYLKAIPRERLAQAQLTDARTSRGKGDLVRAYGLAQGILDSSFRAEAQALIKDVDNDVEQRVERAVSALEGGKVVEAQQLLRAAESLWPARPDVAALVVRANLKSGAARLSPSSVASRVAKRRSAQVTGPAADAQKDFVAGNIDSALKTLDTLNSEDAAALRDKIEKFQEVYAAGLSEHRNKRAGSAIRLLLQAKTLEATISNGTCALLPDIDHKLADMYAVQGTQAFLSNHLPDAYQSFHEAVSLAPDHAIAVRKLTELAQKAQQLLTETSHDSDRARTRAALQTVLEIVPPGSDLYRQAKQRLDALP